MEMEPTIEIYTDATRTDDGKTRIGIAVKDQGRDIIKSYRSTDNTNITDVEATAIRLGQDYIKEQQLYRKTSAIIYTDSLLTLNEFEMKLRFNLTELNKGENITIIKWTNRDQLKENGPELDRTTRQGANKSFVDLIIPLKRRDIRKRGRENALNSWQEIWTREYADICQLLLPIVGEDRIELTFKSTQLVTGHDYMRAYYKRFRLRPTNGECECGCGIEDPVHIMNNCELNYRREAREWGRIMFTGANRDYPPVMSSRGKDDLLINVFNEWAEKLIIEDIDIGG